MTFSGHDDSTINVVLGLLLLLLLTPLIYLNATSSTSPSPSRSPPLPLEVAPLLRLGGLGERFSSPSGSGQSPAAKRYLVNFRLKISPLVATIFRNLGGEVH